MGSTRNKQGHQKVTNEDKQTNLMKNVYIDHSAEHEEEKDRPIDILPPDKRNS